MLLFQAVPKANAKQGAGSEQDTPAPNTLAAANEGAVKHGWLRVLSLQLASELCSPLQSAEHPWRRGCVVLDRLKAWCEPSGRCVLLCCLHFSYFAQGEAANVSDKLLNF